MDKPKSVNNSSEFKFINDKVYQIEGKELNKIWKVALQLYSERKLKDGDEYRDLAQKLDNAVSEAWEY